jgi:hypothetical protein
MRAQAQHDQQDHQKAHEHRSEEPMLFSTTLTAVNTPLQKSAISTSLVYSIFCGAC